MAGEERVGSRLGRALGAVFGFGGREAGKASASVTPGQDGAVLDGSPEEAQPKGEEGKLLNQALTESGLGILFKVDMTGRTTQANEGMELAVGLPCATLMGTEAFSYFGDPNRAKTSSGDRSKRGAPRATARWSCATRRASRPR